MLKKRSKSAELKYLIGLYVQIHVNNLTITAVDGTTGIGFLSGLEGYVVKITEDFLYLSADQDGTASLLVNMDQILVITAVEDPNPKKEFTVLTFDKKE